MNSEIESNVCLYTTLNVHGVLECCEQPSSNRGFCGAHQNDNNTQHYGNAKKYVENITNKYLHEINHTIGKQNKIIIVYNMFDFFCKHKWYLKAGPTFERAVLNKLYEFKDNPDLNMEKYFVILFPEYAEPQWIEKYNNENYNNENKIDVNYNNENKIDVNTTNINTEDKDYELITEYDIVVRI